MGRPSKYETHVKPYFKEIKEWLEQGATEKQVAEQLGINYTGTWIVYKNKYSEFAELIKGKDMKPLVEELRSALVKKALGFEYEEKEQYIKQEVDPVTKQPTGKKYLQTKILTRYQAPDTTAIFGALNIYDNNYVKDRANYELRQQEFELRKQMAEKDNW